MAEEKNSTISIIVPVYNIEKYIEECVNSISSQTYTDLEIILVDDGSSDKSGEICDRLADKDDRIVVLHGRNEGPSAARNHGIDRATGGYIGFVDGDDYIHPQMYEIMMSKLLTEHADIVTCWFERKDPQFGKDRLSIEKINNVILTGTQAVIDIDIPLVIPCNKLCRIEVFDGVRFPVGMFHEDEYMIHELFYNCKRIAVIDRNWPLYFYRYREGSTMGSMTEGRINDALEALSARVAFASEKSWTEVMPAVVKRYCDYCIDRYTDIEEHRIDFGDDVRQKLWKCEKDMLSSQEQIHIDKKYYIFAESPERYYEHMRKREFRAHIKRILTAPVRLPVRFIKERLTNNDR